MSASRRAVAWLLTALVAAGGGALAHARIAELRDARLATAAAPGPVDIGFAQSMIQHHQQAIWMSQFMLDGRPTPLLALARSIADTQLVELGEMRGWLRLWQQPLLPPAQGMGWMLLGSAAPDAELERYLLDCRRSPTGMAGLAADAELDRLRRLDGPERDRHFLDLMLAHHEGGIPMARFAAQQARLPAVRELAARVVLEQSEEIGRMRLTSRALAAVSERGLN